MIITDGQRRLLALCAIRLDKESVDWNLIAREAQFASGLDDLWNGKVQERSATADASQGVLRQGIRNQDELFERVDAEVGCSPRHSVR